MNYFKAILILTLIILCQKGFSQSVDMKRTYHWYFGDSCGIDFSSGLPQIDTNGVIATLEGCASISDTSGKLLFYTDGTYVWDSTHTLMPNGFGLHGNWSSQNSAIIVPNPGNQNIYYVFTTPSYGGDWSGNTAMEYSIVDMSLNSGLGDISIKNVALFSTATEQMGAVRHIDNYNYWVVGHQASNNNFMAYLVTDSGVSTTPVISSVGFENCGDGGCSVLGLKFSASGCRIACTYPNFDTLEIFDFDIASGVVMNPITLNIQRPWTACFSQDDKMLYACTYDYNIGDQRLFQFNLTTNAPSSILASKTYISNVIGLQESMQLGIDGKIYCSKYLSNYLAVITNPNTPGTGCNFISNGFYLGGRTCQAGITNFVQSYFKNETVEYACSYIGIPNEFSNYAIQVFPNPMSEYFVIQSGIDLENATIRILNMQGQKLRDVDNVSGQSTIIGRNDLSNGIYLIQIIQNSKVVTTKKLLVVD